MAHNYTGRHRPAKKKNPRTIGAGVIAALVLLSTPAITNAHKPAAVTRTVDTVPVSQLAIAIGRDVEAVQERTQAAVQAAAEREAAEQARAKLRAEEKRQEERAAARAAEAKKKAEAKRKAALAAAAAASSRRWVRPISYYVLTSGYGWRWGKLHPAQDLAVPVGTPVRAMSKGEVIFAAWSDQGYGYMVQIRYWDGTVSWYAHNSKLLVRVGQKVNVGQTVSYSGNTGHSTGPHLHLEIHPKGQGSVPPAAWLRAKGIPL